MSLAPFDREQARQFNQSRKIFLDGFLPLLQKDRELRTALDVGCGFGFFSSYLRDAGFEVSALDGRESNIVEAQKRNPGIRFEVQNVENLDLTKVGSYDLVLCFGLLYHLENPFRAVRNLAALTKEVLIVETRVAPYRSDVALLYQENHQQDQGLGYVAMIPSRGCLVKMLYSAGFSFVYRIKTLPDHEQFCASPIRKPMRTMFLAAKCEMQSPILEVVPEPTKTNRYKWYRFGIGNALEYFRPLFRPARRT
jgi:tRNA (mo5U34)-methyltransferase